MISRRNLLHSAAGFAATGMVASPWAHAADFVDLPISNGRRPLVKFPQKRPLIQLTARPPQLETPFSVFDAGAITPNDAFFVRYHLAGLPTEIDPETYRLEIKGAVEKPLSLSLDELRTQFDPVEVVAVAQCSGNSRGLFEPRVVGGQLANGAMGNARWKGVPLKAILDRAGIKSGARQVSFEGLDRPVAEGTPEFVKALDVDQARDGEVMVAYAMNGTDLPWLNGFPIRLVVPGYYGTYWVKHLNEVTVLTEVFEGFWMKPAYRVPANACACTPPGEAPATTVPITRFDVRSFITNLADGAKVKAGATLVRGIAFDGGYGITDVAVSADDGRNWQAAELGTDLGRYSFREWRTQLHLNPGAHTLKVRAVNRIGQSQPTQALWNPTGYMRNVVESVRVTAA